MTLEQSHGKVRPTLVRASDLQAASESEGKRSDGRGSDGRFVSGNRHSLGARFAATVKKSLGSRVGAGTARIVTRDARRVFAHVLASLPSDAAPVRALLAIYARHQSLHAYYSLAAEAKGLDTPEGQALLAIADRQSQRAERVLVTSHDLARVHAETHARTGGNVLPAWMVAVDRDETQEDESK